MTFWERNLAALEARFPGLGTELAADAPPFAEQPEFFASRSGPMTARWKGMTLASAFDPLAEALKTVPNVADDVDFVVAGGLGLGYGVEALAARFPDLPLLVAEPSGWWFCRVLEQRDLTTLLANPFVSFQIGGPPSHVGVYLERFSCRKVQFFPHRPTASLFGAWLAELEKALGEFQSMARVNQATLERFVPLWLKNLSRNEAWSQNTGAALLPVQRLRALAPQSKIVITAAGPSLSANLDWLKHHRTQFLLIAVDTSWKSLRAAGVTPDVLVIMDGQYWNARHVDPPVPEPTIVVAEWVSHPSTLRLAPGRTYLSASSVPFLRERERRLWGDWGALKSGGSVATSAWELAVWLGADEVAFCGLDLGYPPGGGHVKGSQFEERKHRQSHRLVPAETLALSWLAEPGLTSRPAVDGRQIPSDPRMDLYRRWLSVAFADHPGIRVWNLSPSGTVIPGASAPPADFADHWARQPVPRWPASGALVRCEPSDSDPSPLGFPEHPDEAWLAQWEAQGAKLWGSAAWKILGATAAATWRAFPGPRALATLRAAWQFESRLKMQIFPSRNDRGFR